MHDLIKEFPEQLCKAIAIGDKASFKTTFSSTIKNIVVCGLGGSGIGGDLLAELLRNQLPIPVLVNKGYSLPAYVDNSSLLLLCSYSGNTEETVSCATEAIARNLQPICITSGGKLAHVATQNNFDLVLIPAGFPPRCCLGYSATQLFFVLKNYGLIDDKFKTTFTRIASFLENEQSEIMAQTEQFASKLLGKVVIIYAEDKYESTALRLKQQINENSKLQCWYNVIPELNHNELVGWREPVDALSFLIIRADDENSRNTARLLFTKDVMTSVTNQVQEIVAKGADTFEKHFYLIHFGDWLSYYLGVQQGYDPIEIDVLIKLKAHMSSIQ